MARPRKNVDESPKVDNSVVLGDELVEVRWYDESSFSFDLVFDGRTIKFVDGAANVTPDVALKLREGGYVK